MISTPPEHAADRAGQADDDVQDRGDGDQLTGEDEDGADPQKRRDSRPHEDAETELEEVADRPEIVLGGHAPDGRTDPEREHDRTDRRGSHPPECGQAVAVREARRPDGRSRADIRREHRGEQQPGPEGAAGDEEVARRAHTTSDPDAERDLGGGVGDQKDEVRHLSKGLK